MLKHKALHRLDEASGLITECGRHIALGPSSPLQAEGQGAEVLPGTRETPSTR